MAKIANSNTGVFRRAEAGGHERLLILADSRVGFAQRLARAFVEAASETGAFEAVLICDTARARPDSIVWGAARRAYEAFRPPTLGAGGGRRLYAVAREFGVPIRLPPGRNVNAAGFRRVVDEWRPTLTLSLACRQILQPPLLEALGYVVNFHDGKLPDYRGLMATGWSVYGGAARSGYSYHQVEVGIDTGPLLVTGDLRIRNGERMMPLLARKIEHAAGAAELVLQRMLAREEGSPQQAGGSYYSGAKARKLRRIESPERLSAEELVRRLRAFALLELRVGGRWYEVTELEVGQRSGHFVAACGKRLVIRRCLGLPVLPYRLYRALRPPP